MQVVCNLSHPRGKGSWIANDSELFAVVIKNLLDAQVRNNLLYLKSHHNVPPLYRSGVRYENEPAWKFQGEVAEEFALIPIVLARGFGDCDDLSPWRVAELLNAGEPASIRVQWKRRTYPNGAKGRKYFHIVVRRADGTIEDPSAKLGMHERNG